MEELKEAASEVQAEPSVKEKPPKAAGGSKGSAVISANYDSALKEIPEVAAVSAIAATKVALPLRSGEPPE